MRKPPPRQPKVVSDVRSPHGTRVMKRIVCSRCGKSDMLPFVPKAGESPLCQSCAQESFNVISENEQGSADKYIACRRCGTKFPAAKKPREQFVPRGLEDVADQLTQRDLNELCIECRGITAVERRNLAKKPRGVHPIVVKGRRTKE